MDCCICSPMIAVYRPPRNTICSRCYDGAKDMIRFLKDIDGDREVDGYDQQLSNGAKTNSSMGISDAFKRMKELKEKEEGMNERLGFADELVVALKEGIHADILVQPGTGPPIPAHRALLATRSEIFRTLLTSDKCKSPPEHTISLPELTHDELQYLLEFLYCGSLKPADKTEEHVYSLLIAADKYDIPFLRRCCEDRILISLGPSNVLRVLEAAEICSNIKLKEHAMRSVVKHVEDVVLSRAYDSFATKNAHLCVEITRALLLEMKARREEQFMNAF